MGEDDTPEAELYDPIKYQMTTDEYGKPVRKKRPAHEYDYGVENCKWKPYERFLPQKYHWILREAKKKMFLVDNHHWTRIFGILDEFAEALDHKILPDYLKPIRKPIYYSLWAVTLGYLGIRNVLEGFDKHSFTDMLKNLLHDGVAATWVPVKIIHFVSRLYGKLCNSVGSVFGRGGSLLSRAGRVFQDITQPFVSFKITGLVLKYFLDPVMTAITKTIISPLLDSSVKPFLDKYAHEAIKWLFAKTVGLNRGLI